MPTRNTEALRQIIQTLDSLLISEPHALARLEKYSSTRQSNPHPPLDGCTTKERRTQSWSQS